MAGLDCPFCTSYLISGSPQERIFAALLDVRRFPEWALGLKGTRTLDPVSKTETSEVSTGAILEFILSTAGLTHRVVSTVTVVEPPRRLEWRYTEGAKGSGAGCSRTRDRAPCG